MENEEGNNNSNSATSGNPSQPLYARDVDNAESAAAGKVPSKGSPTIIRVLVVLIYLFTVSFAALLLSAYYIFFWTPKIDDYGKDRPERLTGGCDDQN